MVGFLEHPHSDSLAVFLVAFLPSLMILPYGESLSNLLAFNIFIIFYDNYVLNPFAINNHGSD